LASQSKASRIFVTTDCRAPKISR